MSATLIREYALPDVEWLGAVLADLAPLPEQLADRRGHLFREAALTDRAGELHAGRDEYRRIYDEYIGVAEQFRALAETAGSPLAAEFDRVAAGVRRQRDEVFGRWQTFDDLCGLLIEYVQPSAERLKALANKYPPPQSWYEETDDPFAAD
ncbi:MAG: hypothetical protein K2P78_10160 [Gemmataceae bacterium]|nr:hypothetical protein [Gemmataceae bacterium]